MDDHDRKNRLAACGSSRPRSRPCRLRRQSSRPSCTARKPVPSIADLWLVNRLWNGTPDRDALSMTLGRFSLGIRGKIALMAAFMSSRWLLPKGLVIESISWEADSITVAARSTASDDRPTAPELPHRTCRSALHLRLRCRHRCRGGLDRQILEHAAVGRRAILQLSEPLRERLEQARIGGAGQIG